MIVSKDIQSLSLSRVVSTEKRRGGIESTLLFWDSSPPIDLRRLEWMSVRVTNYNPGELVSDDHVNPEESVEGKTDINQRTTQERSYRRSLINLGNAESGPEDQDQPLLFPSSVLLLTVFLSAVFGTEERWIDPWVYRSEGRMRYRSRQCWDTGLSLPPLSEGWRSPSSGIPHSIHVETFYTGRYPDRSSWKFKIKKEEKELLYISSTQDSQSNLDLTSE